MYLQGHVENGVVVFDEPISLPEGTAVRIEPVPEESVTNAEQDREAIARDFDLLEKLCQASDPEDEERLERALQEARQQAKEQVRRQMGL